MKKRIGMLGILLCMGIATSTAYAGSWSLVENEWYYLNEQGEKQTGWIKDQGNYYYLDVHGVMQTGWVEFSGSWYYFADDGSMVSGDQTIRGIDYSFSEHGWLIDGPGMDMEYSASIAPNMTWQMCTADYWIDRMNKPNEVLLTEDEIQDLNQKILKQSGTNMYDLSNIAPTFNGVKMAANNANFKSPTGLYLDGKAVPEEYYEAIRNNIRNANVTEKMEIKYAFSVNRTEMKAYPYEEFLSDSKTDVEWDNLVSAAIRVNEPLVVYFFTAD